MIRERARAKINLTLTVSGRRSDGYHELDSLVTFADIADEIAFTPGPDLRVTSVGPFAAEIPGPNLVETALQRLRDADAGLRLGAVVLTKNLPVAAGLGGGSADAAAVLRAARLANPSIAPSIDWHAIATSLGADVPVCLDGRPSLMWGIGERIEALANALPALPAVLVNPRLPLPTAAVFAALQAGPAPTVRRPTWHEGIANAEQLLDAMRARGNDLEPPAVRLLPVVAEIKAVLLRQRGCRIAALSGSGPTCFGIFTDDTAASSAASTLAAAHPAWWVVATRLAGT